MVTFLSSRNDSNLVATNDKNMSLQCEEYGSHHYLTGQGHSRLDIIRTLGNTYLVYYLVMALKTLLFVCFPS